jgi:hypothetical protein
LALLLKVILRESALVAPISPTACSTRSASACMIASMMPLLSLIEANRDVLEFTRSPRRRGQADQQEQ